MVNTEKRKMARRLLQGFFMGEITNDDLENNYPADRDDAALGAIYERLWEYWDDRRARKIRPKDDLGDDACAVFERCIAFLGSDLEYEWPEIHWFSFSTGLLRLVGLGKLTERKGREYLNQIGEHGNLEVWPFIRERDYARFK